MISNDLLVKAVEEMPYCLSIKSPRDPLVLEALRKVDRKKFLDNRKMVCGIGDPHIINNIFKTRRKIEREFEEKKKLVEGNPNANAEVNQEDYDSLTNYAWELAGRVFFGRIPIKYLAYNDTTIEIGEGQTCSQPSLIALMNDLLELKPGYNVLEIGSGCGYHAALTAELIGEKGRLTTIEINPNLAKMARSNLEKHFKERAKKIEFVVGDGSIGYLPNAPYDRIYLTAAPHTKNFNPQPFIDQLNKNDGILIFPTEYNHNLNLVKFSNGKEERKSFYGVSFVELKGDNS